MAARKRPPNPKVERRIALGQKRILNILRQQTVANARTLEQKIADAGPNNQRVDPVHMTKALQRLRRDKAILYRMAGGSAKTRWYFLAETPEAEVDSRLGTLLPVWQEFNAHDITSRRGQTLEIAIFRSLREQDYFHFWGHFDGIDDEPDSALYSKQEPPSHLSGRSTPGALDFMLQSPTGTCLGVEAKNIREWLYPDRDEVRALIGKCCELEIVPVLIARRIPYVSFSEVFNPCGIIVHQTYNQLLPASDEGLANKARNKNLLGYHDIRTGNTPDTRLNRFLHDHLPNLVEEAAERFFGHIDILRDYASGEIEYKHLIPKIRGEWRDEDTDLD